MKIGLTINLGDFNSLRVETGEHEKYHSCIKELIHILQKTPHPAVRVFYRNLYGSDLPKPSPGQQYEKGVKTLAERWKGDKSQD